MEKPPYAEKVNYWQTSRVSSDSWITKAKVQIEKVGGTILGEVFGSNSIAGTSAYMIAFQIGSDQFKLVWPVLESETGNHAAARIQAATMLYHDVKAKCIAAKVHGTRKSFFPYLMLDSGQVASDVGNPELTLALESSFLLSSIIIEESEQS